MEKQSKTKTRKVRRWIPQDIKMEIVRDFHFEGLKQALIAERHGISQQTVSRILCNFAAENNKSALLMGKDANASESEEIKALRKEVLELKRQLYDETMRADFYDTMIDVAEEMFGIEIRKKAGTGQSKGCTKTK